MLAELSQINNQGRDSIRIAEFKAKLRKLFSLTDKSSENYFSITADEAVNRFVALITFLYDVKMEELWSVVEKYDDLNYSELYRKLLNQPEPTTSMPASVSIQPENTIAPPQAFVNPPRAKKESETRSEKLKKLSYAEMKEQIENQFKKDAQGQFMNISEVLKELERLAAKYEDDHIRDLYIFNEADRKFEWNETLIKE
ncbi:MAG: hypothetical protein AAB467_00985 [Patescibacteria group bacterium]